MLPGIVHECLLPPLIHRLEQDCLRFPLICPQRQERKRKALHDYRTTAVGIHILRKARDCNRPVVHSSHCSRISYQLEVFLQTEFKRLGQEACVKGGRIHVERAVAADYEQVLREVSACLLSAKKRAA